MILSNMTPDESNTAAAILADIRNGIQNRTRVRNEVNAIIAEIHDAADQLGALRNKWRDQFRAIDSDPAFDAYRASQQCQLDRARVAVAYMRLATAH